MNLAHSSRLLSVVAKKSQWQDGAAHITSIFRKQRSENERSTYLLLLWSRVSRPGIGPACYRDGSPHTDNVIKIITGMLRAVF